MGIVLRPLRSTDEVLQHVVWQEGALLGTIIVGTCAAARTPTPNNLAPFPLSAAGYQFHGHRGDVPCAHGGGHAGPH